MKYLITYAIGSILLFGCNSQLIDNDSELKSEIDTNNLYGSYTYSRSDTLISSRDSIHFSRYLHVTLNLFEDKTFEQINENMECFANLPDYGGTYVIKDSIIICTIDAMLGRKNDSTNRYEIIDFIKVEPNEIEYKIEDGLIINLADEEIKLKRTKANTQ